MKRISSAAIVLGFVLLGIVLCVAVSEPGREIPSVGEARQVTATAVPATPSPDLSGCELGQPTLAPPRPATEGFQNATAQGVVCAQIQVEIAESAN